MVRNNGIGSTFRSGRMKMSRYKEEQIIGFLKEAEAGFPIADLCRREVTDA